MKRIAILLVTILLGATGTNTFAATSVKKAVVKQVVAKKTKKVIKKAKPVAKKAAPKKISSITNISSGATAGTGSAAKTPDTTTKAS